MDWMFVSRQNVYINALTSCVAIFGDGTFKDVIKITQVESMGIKPLELVYL